MVGLNFGRFFSQTHLVALVERRRLRKFFFFLSFFWIRKFFESTRLFETQLNSKWIFYKISWNKPVISSAWKLEQHIFELKLEYVAVLLQRNRIIVYIYIYTYFFLLLPVHTNHRHWRYLWYRRCYNLQPTLILMFQGICAMWYGDRWQTGNTASNFEQCRATRRNKISLFQCKQTLESGLESLVVFYYPMTRTNVDCWQGGQMSYWKNRPECGPIFLSKLM
jgi:hypothetical protein